MKLIAAISTIGVLAALTIPTAAFADDQDSDGVLDTDDKCLTRPGAVEHKGCPFPVIARTEIKRPPKSVSRVVRKWRPWAKPSPRQVVRIARAEQRKWGGPSIVGLLSCESGLSWSATNGQYQGLAQFGSIWWSMWPGTPRKVRMVEKRLRTKYAIKYSYWTDGQRTEDRWGKVRQRQKITRVGKLPKNATPYHGYAAIRVTQRAFAGVGPTTSWACGV